MANSDSSQASAAERGIAIGAVAIAVVSLLALLTILIAGMLGAQVGGDPVWFWDALIAIVYYGFPLAFLLVVVLIVWRMIANRRADRSA